MVHFLSLHFQKGGGPLMMIVISLVVHLKDSAMGLYNNNNISTI